MVSGARDKRILYVEAQAGQGKTCLALQYLKHIEADFAWYAIDATDEDPVALIGTLFETLAAGFPALRQSSFLESPLSVLQEGGREVGPKNDMPAPGRRSVPGDLTFSAMQILTASERLHWVLLDEALQPITFSDQTHVLMTRLFGRHHSSGLPEDLKSQLGRTIQDKCKDLAHGRACSFKLYLQQGHLICYLYPLPEQDSSSAYVLKLIPNGPTEDFTALAATGLTEREATVLSYLPLGYSNAQLATALDISENGVKKHLSSIARKLGAPGRAEILYKAMLRKREIDSRHLPEIPKIRTGGP